MNCYYTYLSRRRKALQSIILDDQPLVIVDIDQDGNSMGVEYCG